MVWASDGKRSRPPLTVRAIDLALPPGFAPEAFFSAKADDLDFIMSYSAFRKLTRSVFCWSVNPMPKR